MAMEPTSLDPREHSSVFILWSLIYIINLIHTGTRPESEGIPLNSDDPLENFPIIPSIRHAKLGDHGSSHALHLLQVSPSPSGHLGASEDQLLSHTATQSSSNARLASLACGRAKRKPTTSKD